EDLSAFVVFQVDNIEAEHIGYFVFTAAEGNDYESGFTVAGAPADGFFRVNRNDMGLASGDVRLGEGWQLVSILVADGQLRVYVNGELKAEDEYETQTMDFTRFLLSVRGGGGNYFAQNDYAELIIFDWSPDDETHAAIGCELATTYDLSLAAANFCPE
ncbi:MAG: hypothetical protein KC561_08365, partial [Myxococcales bacterium]|nr:hypothetical protein [Myxococcales bacterium]